MLVRQNKVYDNLKSIDTNLDDNDYGYFYELDLIETIDNNSQNNIINNYVNTYYFYTFGDNKKTDNYTKDYEEDEYKDNEEYVRLLKKQDDIYFMMNVFLITTTGLVMLYFTLV